MFWEITFQNAVKGINVGPSTVVVLSDTKEPPSSFWSEVEDSLIHRSCGCCGDSWCDLEHQGLADLEDLLSTELEWTRTKEPNFVLASFIGGTASIKTVNSTQGQLGVHMVFRFLPDNHLLTFFRWTEHSPCAPEISNNIRSEMKRRGF